MDTSEEPEWMSITGDSIQLPPSADFLGACKPISSYKVLNLLGQGSFGLVHQALDPSNQVVALKQLVLAPEDRDDGIPLSALREIAVLRTLQHQNIVNVLDIAVDDGKHGKEGSYDDLWMVMEYCEQDLAKLIDDEGVVLKLGEVKCLFKQLLQGLEYLHRKDIIHRDVKTENLLLTANGTLKLADFNTARTLPNPPRPMTPSISTLWYAAPEILLSSPHYTRAVDTFAAALVLAELLLREPLFQAETPVELLKCMIKLLGSPSRDDIDALHQMGCPDLGMWRREGLVSGRPDNLGRRFDKFGEATTRVVRGLLRWDPRARWSASEAKGKGKGEGGAEARDWWEDSPRAVRPEELPKWHVRGEEREEGDGKESNKRAGAGESSETGYVFDFEDPLVRRPVKRARGE